MLILFLRYVFILLSVEKHPSASTDITDIVTMILRMVTDSEECGKQIVFQKKSLVVKSSCCCSQTLSIVKKLAALFLLCICLLYTSNPTPSIVPVAGALLEARDAAYERATGMPFVLHSPQTCVNKGLHKFILFILLHFFF